MLSLCYFIVSKVNYSFYQFNYFVLNVISLIAIFKETKLIRLCFFKVYNGLTGGFNLL